MDRLTQRNDTFTKEAIPVLVRGRGFGPAFFEREIDYQDYKDALTRLCEYEDAEEQGRLVNLPVKSGDTVYQLRDKKHALGVGVHPRHISCVCVYGNDWIAMHQGDKPCAKKDLGKTWFLTREEAESALKGERR